MKESEIQKSILDYLTYRGHLPIKFNNVGIRKSNGQYIPPRQKGISDIPVCLKSGQFGAIEVKRPGNHPTPEQLDFIREVVKRGGIGIVAYSLDDVIKAGL